MISKNETLQLQRWLDNLKEPALKQALKFLLCPKYVSDREKTREYILRQIEEFNRMYPPQE